ncbi:protein giant-like isoform X3 [Harmonia axyridis]|uniref:protein giant-like isoform X3 n=1 Tax=Harmonia axyridis TaxID=115357 RepID=UPI001E2767C2|nr:protein giant-like isoform X3 [Harmonia axyridis]
MKCFFNPVTMVLTIDIKEEIENSISIALNKCIRSDSFIESIVHNVTEAVIRTIETRLSQMEKTVKKIQDKQSMKIMDYNAPIDLRISKSKSNDSYSDTIRNSRNILLNQSPKKLQELLHNSSMQPNYGEINAPTQIINNRTNLIRNSLESRVPSVSPDSSQKGCYDCKQTNSQNEEIKPFKMEVISRRFSECSILSDQANNNENRKIVEIETTSDIPKKRKRSNDTPTTVHSDSGFSSNEIEEDEDLSKNHHSKPLRIDMPPISVPPSETDPLPLKGPLGDFETFRKNILSRVNSSNQSTNHNMRRMGNTTNTHITDPAYWEKRRRNNEAAKRSRDARRRKEDEVAIRCAYLEQERILMLQENRLLKEALQKYEQYYRH